MKKTLDGINALYPTPTVIVGAMVDGKPNYITIAHIGIVNHARPYLISLSSAKVHYTNAGIKQNNETLTPRRQEIYRLFSDLAILREVRLIRP